jgi:ribosomal protein S18 acetylase RimI-like enzyme
MVLMTIQKVRAMYEAHSAAAGELKGSYPPNSLYYLEIAAVHPDSQGLGVGGKLMKAINKHVGDSPCFLECTNLDNVPFYEKYGFRVTQERKLKLREGDDSCILYYMVRDPTANTDTDLSDHKSSSIDIVNSV